MRSTFSRRCKCGLIAFLLASHFALATPVTLNVGLLSFDVLIPGSPPDPGVNVLNVLNATGDPLSGGSALPPDFSVYTALMFTDAHLLVVTDSVTQDLALGDIGSGSLASPPDLASDVIIRSVTLFAIVQPVSVVLSDGTTAVISNADIAVTLTPSSGNALTAGVDLVTISVAANTDDDAVIPEPATWSLCLIATAMIGWRRLRCYMPI
jgi:hypothetical protein